jgi:hypothetical protein
MGLDIGGNTITQASSVLTINTGKPMRLLSSGPVMRPNQCQFIAEGTGGAWVNLSNGWTGLNNCFQSASLNVNGCYNTTLSRFTAPVAGMYFFQYCGAHYLKDGANLSYYWHPVFAVNSSQATATASGNINYRLRGHGVSIATYDDGSISQIYKLSLGDYVEIWVFSNGSPLNRIYPPYQKWYGILLG